MRVSFTTAVALFSFAAGALLSGGVLCAVYINTMRTAPNRVEILVCRNTLIQYGRIEDPAKVLEIVVKPEDQLPPGYIPADRLHDLKGRRLRITVERGFILTENCLSAKNTGGVICGPQQGPRAMSVKTTLDRDASESIVPGCRVVVLLTKDKKRTVVLTNVVVLAVDPSPLDLEAKSEKVHPFVTIELDASGCEKLAKAKDSGGNISLLLRVADDDADPAGPSAIEK